MRTNHPQIAVAITVAALLFVATLGTSVPPASAGGGFGAATQTDTRIGTLTKKSKNTITFFGTTYTLSYKNGNQRFSVNVSKTDYNSCSKGDVVFRHKRDYGKGKTETWRDCLP